MKRQAISLLLFGLSMTGCTLGPEYQRPATAADGLKSNSNAAETGQGNLSPWWMRFGDPTTSELVRVALKNNTDLQVAAARVLEAQAGFKSAEASIWPQLNYNFTASHTKSSFVLPEMGRRTVYSTTYSAGLSLSYQLDLFGKLKRSRQAQWASFLAEEANRLTVEHSIIAGVVRSRVALANAEDAKHIAEEIRDSWKQTLKTIERRYSLGLAGAVDLYLARENLAAAEATVRQLGASVTLARNGLDVLLGRSPGSGPEIPQTLPELPDLDEIPAGIPVALLDRRPDLIQAEMNLKAATYGVGAALADLYPSLSLTGSTGTTSDTLSDLLDSKASVYNLVGNLLGPIFSGGSRKAAVKVARARAEAAAASYSGAVLKALEDVANALAQDTMNRERLDDIRAQLKNARAADQLARDRYRRGVEAFLKVLETERRLRAAEQAMMSARADTWNARIDLFLALGGDWSLPEPSAENHKPKTPVQGS